VTDDACFGLGTVSFDATHGRWRYRLRIGGKDTSAWFATEQEAKDAREVYATKLDVIGVTLAELCEERLIEVSFTASAHDTVRSLILSDDIAKRAAHAIEDWDVREWVKRTSKKRATRSVLANGKRTRVELDHVISRDYVKQALSFIRGTYDWARNHYRHIKSNPAKDVRVERSQHKKEQPRKKGKYGYDYLPSPDCAKVFFCADCEAKSGVRSDDIEQLVTCPHVPLFYRVGLSVSIMQGLRQGELLSQRWERIEWSGSPDWTGNMWWVNTSWDSATKTGVRRHQALIPMAARLLHRWWVHKGQPRTGLVFSKADEPPRKPMGELALFVARYPHHSNRDLLREAEDHGIALTLRRIETLRSEARKRAERLRRKADQMFAEGYDFAWSDTKTNSKQGLRRGWMSRLGLSVRVTFHDHRDTAATHLLSASWGDQWTIEMVSDFLGHSDIAVTRKRYAHVTTEAKTVAAAGIDPRRCIAAPQTSSVQRVSRASSMPTALSAENAWAPELGLEPRTTRLTVERSTN
jgi:integrase